MHYLAISHLFSKFHKGAFSSQANQHLDLYCAARQLNDDIHDWQDDLRHGKITYVVAKLFDLAQILPGESYKIEPLIKTLQKVFWETGLEELLNKCNTLAKKSLQGFRATLNVIAGSSFEIATLDPIISSTQQALKQHTFNKEFLELAKHRY